MRVLKYFTFLSLFDSDFHYIVIVSYYRVIALRLYMMVFGVLWFWKCEEVVVGVTFSSVLTFRF